MSEALSETVERRLLRLSIDFNCRTRDERRRQEKDCVEGTAAVVELATAAEETLAEKAAVLDELTVFEDEHDCEGS